MDENKKETNLVPEADENTQENSKAHHSSHESEETNQFASGTEIVPDESASNNATEPGSGDEHGIVVQAVDGSEAPKAKKRKDHKKFWTIFLSAFLAVVLLAGGLWMILDPLTAVKVGSQRLSIQEYEYYYKSYVMKEASTFSTYYGLDTSKDLSKQTCPLKNEDGSSVGTWKDYFDAAVKTYLQQNIAVYDEAKKNKETLNADNLKDMEETITQIKDAAKSAGQSLEEYTKSTYGSALSERNLLKILRRQSLANQYFADKFSPDKEFSDEELNAYYEKNKEQFEKTSFRYFPIAIDTEKKDGAASAKAKADAMLAKITDEKSFIAQAKANATEDQKESMKEDNATLITGWTKDYGAQSSAPDELLNWVFDKNRKVGDKTAVTDGSTYYVLYCTAPPYKDVTPLAEMRHILIQPEVGTDGQSTDAHKKAAKEKAESLYKQWQAGDKTEDSFAELAKKNSADSKSASEGGLLADIARGNLVAPIDTWLFDSARKYGDSGIIESSYGCHIVYYVKQGTPAWSAEVKSTMNTENKQNAVIKLGESAKYKVNKIGMKYVDLTF